MRARSRASSSATRWTCWVWSSRIGYAIAAVAAVATFGAALLLRLWDRPSVDEGDLPWWLTWQRTLLLSVIDFGFGAIGPLSGHVGRGMLPMYVVTFSLLPLLYNVLGIGTRTYRREQLLLWPLWALGTTAAGGDAFQAALLALGVFVLCMTVGAGQIRGWDLAFRRLRSWLG